MATHGVWLLLNMFSKYWYFVQFAKYIIIKKTINKQKTKTKNIAGFVFKSIGWILNDLVNPRLTKKEVIATPLVVFARML